MDVVENAFFPLDSIHMFFSQHTISPGSEFLLSLLPTALHELLYPYSICRWGAIRPFRRRRRYPKKPALLLQGKRRLAAGTDRTIQQMVLMSFIHSEPRSPTPRQLEKKSRAATTTRRSGVLPSILIITIQSTQRLKVLRTPRPRPPWKKVNPRQRSISPMTTAHARRRQTHVTQP